MDGRGGKQGRGQQWEYGSPVPLEGAGGEGGQGPASPGKGQMGNKGPL